MDMSERPASDFTPCTPVMLPVFEGKEERREGWWRVLCPVNGGWWGKIASKGLRGINRQKRIPYHRALS